MAFLVLSRLTSLHVCGARVCVCVCLENSDPRVSFFAWLYYFRLASLSSIALFQSRRTSSSMFLFLLVAGDHQPSAEERNEHGRIRLISLFRSRTVSVCSSGGFEE